MSQIGGFLAILTTIMLAVLGFVNFQKSKNFIAAELYKPRLQSQDLKD